MPALATAAQDWLARGVPAVVVEVARTRGSVPRESGTRMLVSAREVAGTIGGGHLEWQAIAQARALLANPSSAPWRRDYPLGPALGQCCGGVVTLRYLLLNSELTAKCQPAPSRFFLQMYGAGHVGRAIARLLAGIACTVDWIDEREQEFPQSLAADGGWPAHIRRIAVDAVEAEVAEAPAGACYLVLTHQHELDWRITGQVLARADFAYLGLIGSKTKRAKFFHRFEQRGVAPDLLARISCPIGIAGVAGKEPEVIAVAVVAQLLQCAAGTATVAQPVSIARWTDTSTS